MTDDELKEAARALNAEDVDMPDEQLAINQRFIALLESGCSCCRNNGCDLSCRCSACADVRV